MNIKKDGDEARRVLALYEASLQPLRRYVQRVLGDVSGADDVVQECFLRAFTSPNLPRNPKQARAYIFQIASNIIVDGWRRRKRDGSLDIEAEVSTAPEEVALRMDLDRVFAMLALRERQLIWLAFVEGLDHPTIATHLGLRRQSVKVLLHRARTKFAMLLRRSGYDDR